MGNSLNPFIKFDTDYLRQNIPITEVIEKYAGISVDHGGRRRIPCPSPGHLGDNNGKNTQIKCDENICCCHSHGTGKTEVFDSLRLAREYYPNMHFTDFCYQLAQDFGIPLEVCSDIAERQQAQKEHRKIFPDFFPLKATDLAELGLLVEKDKGEITDDTEQKFEYTKAYIAECKKHINDTQYHRGLSPETLDHFDIGFDPEWHNPTSPYDKVFPRLIIPTSDHSYLARATVKFQDDDTTKRYKCRKVGKVPIFNERVLDESKPVFLVEGEIDAMSFHEIRSNAVGLGGTSGVDAILKRFEQHPPTQPIIVAMDNDPAGRDAKVNLIAGLDKLGISYVAVDVSAPYKDANEALNADREGFAKTVRDTEAYAIRMKSKERLIPPRVKSALDEIPTTQSQQPAGTESVHSMWVKGDKDDKDAVEAAIVERISNMLSQYKTVDEACTKELQALESKYTPEQWQKNMVLYERYNEFVKEHPTTKLHMTPEMLAQIKDAASMSFTNDIAVRTNERIQHFTEMKEKVQAQTQARDKFYKENPPQKHTKEWGRG